MSGMITWLGHAGFAINLPPLVVIDPYQLPGPSPRKADIVLVTHAHYDHCSPEDIAKVTGPKTVFIGPAQCAGKLPKGAKTIAAGQKIEIAGAEIEAVPAYNVNKKFHPKGAGGVGYVIRKGGEAIYHAGDTDLIPEMEEIRCTVALLPVSGTYVMTAAEAAKAVELIKPKIAIPMHIGPVVGGPADAESFKKACPAGTEVLTPAPGTGQGTT